jgi:hypothetical protein
MLRFAKEQGWIEENPFPRGVALGPAVPLYKDDRIMTREEEGRLHAACSGKFAYLLPALIYVADAPAYLRDFLKLRWADVDFEGGLIPGHRGLVEMTPRLSEAIRSLRGLSRSRPDSPVVSRSVDQCNYDFEKVRAAAGVGGLKWTDIRRTGAWRLERTGKDTRQIAARLGMTHLDNVAALLRVNPDAAKLEAALPGFDQFVLSLFGGSVNGKGQVETRAPRLDRQKFLARVRKFIVEVWREKRPSTPDKITREDVAKKFAARGRRPTTGAGVRDNLSRCDVKVDWKVFVWDVLREAGKL